jgi:hypothetical protein
VLAAATKIYDTFVELFLNIKRETEYSDSQIDRKRM